MQISDFIGKTIKAIYREEPVAGLSATLILFEDESQILVDDIEAKPIFFTETAIPAEDNIETVSFDNFWKKVSEKN